MRGEVKPILCRSVSKHSASFVHRYRVLKTKPFALGFLGSLFLFRRADGLLRRSAVGLGVRKGRKGGDLLLQPRDGREHLHEAFQGGEASCEASAAAH